MRTRRLAGRLLLALAGPAILFFAADLWMRTRVGECGLTPFKSSDVQGLPHLLFAGRETIYKGVPVRINSLGLRGGELAAPPAGWPRVALIGDSVTFGNGCREEETLAAALAAELAARGTPAQVLNCGTPAYNADNVATMLRERVLALQPDRVIWVMVANDVCDSLRRTEIPVDATIDAYADFRFGSPLMQMVNQHGSALLRRMGLPIDGYVESVLRQHVRTGDERLRRALAEMRQRCAAASIPFGVAIYPYMTRLDSNPFAPIENACAALCDELGVPCVRLADAFAPDENLVRFWVAPLDPHPGAEANRRVVEVLADKYFAKQ
jgi:lysophospholipase L1-like esterase